MTQLSRRSLLKLAGLAGLATAAGLSTTACSGVGGASGDSADGKTTIRYAFWGNNVRQQNYTKAWDLFQQDNTDIGVEIEFADYAAFQERMTTQMAARNVAEIFWVAAPQVMTYDKNGIYHDLEGIDTLKLDDFSAEELDAFKLNGKLNTMPFGIFVPVLRYNTTYADKAEITLPADGSGWSWDAVAEIATDFSKENKDIRGLAYNADADLPFESWARQHGEQLWTQDGKVGYSADTLAGWLNWWDKLQKAGGCLTVSEQDGATADWSVIGAKVLMNFGNSNHIIDDAKMYPDYGFKLRHMPTIANPTAGYQYLYTPRMAIYSGIEDAKIAAAGTMIDFNVNNIEMLKTVGLTMGAPTNPRVAKEAVAIASDTEKDMLAIVNDDRTLTDRKPRYEAPPGSSTWRTTFTRVCEEVALGKSTPAQAAATMIEEINTGIDRAAA